MPCLYLICRKLLPKAVLFLADNDITGEHIAVNGGLCAGA